MSKQHDNSRDDAEQDRAMEYVFGSMDEHDRRSFEARLAAQPELARVVHDVRESAVDLAKSSPEFTPPPSLRARLMQRIQGQAEPLSDRQVWRRWKSEGGERHLIRASHETWQPTEFTGIEVRCLAVDEAASRVTMMIRMAAGARYPGHRHGGVEECYVLSGDLRQGAQVMGAGDYEWCDRESVHGEQWTEGGCTILIHSSQHDELLPQ